MELNMNENLSSDEYFNLIMEQVKIFEKNHIRFNAKQVKTAGARARKSINEIGKLARKYRSTSVQESKEISK